MHQAINHTLCPSCDGWQIQSGDRMCGNCGDVLLQANVDIIPSVVYKDTATPKNIQIIVTKKHGNLDGTDFLWRNTRTNAEIRLDEVAFTPAAHDDTTIDIEFPFESLVEDRSQKEEWQLIHRIMDDCEPVLGTINIGRELPTLKLSQTDILLEGDQPKVVLQLINEKGVCFNISEMSVATMDGNTRNNLPIINDGLKGLTICEGDMLDISLNLPQKLAKQLHDLPAGTDYKLDIDSLDFPDGQIFRPEPEFRIRVPKPARPTIKTNDKEIKALQKGRINLPITLENRGGEPCTIQGFDLEIIGRNQDPVNIHIDIDPITLDIGKGGEEKLIRTSLKDIDLNEGMYFLNVNIITDSSDHNGQTQFELHIKKPKSYKGIVVIDFGTTASAAACYMRTGSPKIIALSDDRKATYIPTAIAYYLDAKNELQSTIGEKAFEKFKTLPANKVRLLDNLKWRLQDTAPLLLPDGSKKQWREAAADYLNAVKQRIEDHPDVMAIIDNVCITEPARFIPQLSKLLHNAYQASNMNPMILYSGNRSIKAISESWPASMLSLQGKEISLWQKRYKLDDDWKSNNAKYLWLNFDMGGGSTDLSLMTINVEGYDHMHLKEIASTGDNNIAGNFISSLIYKHIRLVNPDGGKIDLSNFPIVLPWGDNNQNTNDNEVAVLNGHQIFDDIIFPIQKSDPLLRGVIEESYDTFLQESAEVQQDLTQLWLDETLLEKKSISDVIVNFNEIVKYHMQENPEQRLSVVLKSIHGADSEFSFKQIEFDGKGFIKDFITEVSIPLYKSIHGLLEKTSDNYIDHKVFFILTGRGSMFPLVNDLIKACFSKLKEESNSHSEYDVRAIFGDDTKTIVCDGACHIGHLLSQGIQFDGIKFEPLPAPLFGLLTGKDRETGQYYFEPLKNGIIYPEDGWYVVKHPVRVGGHDLSITFCQNIDNEETFIPKNDNRYIIEGQVDFSAEDASNTHLLVRMLEDGNLEASFAVPPIDENGEEGEIGEATPDYEQWEKQVLGTYQLLPNTTTHANDEIEKAETV